MKSISHKLVLGMLVLTALTIVIIWLYQVVYLESHYLHIKTKDIKKEVNSLESLFSDGQTAAFLDKAENIAYAKNIAIELLDGNGEVLYSTGNPLLKGQAGFGRTGVRDAIINNTLAENEYAGSLKHPRFNTEIILYAKKILSEEKSAKILLVSLPVESVSETVMLIKNQIVYIIAILLILSVLMGTFISRTLVKPILKLNKSVQAMAGGDLSIRIEPESQDEIGELTKNFDKMAVELNRTDSLRKELIANVSHELRTPLGLIRGYAEMVRDIGNEQKKTEHLNVIIDESERLSAIVNDILELSQLQSGHTELKPVPFDIAKLIEQTVEKYAVISGKNKISLSFAGESGEVIIRADRAKIEQVLHNLIANALNHTPEHGTVTVTLEAQQGTSYIEVRDSGPGIAQEDIGHIWERYYKSRKTERKIIDGTGLGLAIVKEILQAHGFRHGVRSHPGQGSAFYFEVHHTTDEE